jgi:phosphoribosylamine-glycine ligase
MTEYEHIVFSGVLLGGIALIVGIVVVLDWFARRKDREARNKAA